MAKSYGNARYQRNLSRRVKRMSITTEEIDGKILYGVKCDECGRHHHHMHGGDWHTIHKEATNWYDGWTSYGGYAMETVKHKCPKCGGTPTYSVSER